MQSQKITEAVRYAKDKLLAMSPEELNERLSKRELGAVGRAFVDSMKHLDDYFANVTDEQLEEDLKQAGYYNNSCHPDTCQMQCQGAGWCHLCKEFRGELTEDDCDDYWEELLP